MADKLRLIDIAQASTLVVLTIARYERSAVVAKVVEDYMLHKWPKRPTIKIRVEVEALLTSAFKDHGWEYIGVAVRYASANSFMDRKVHNITVLMGEENLTFSAVTKDDGSLDVDNAMLGHRLWTTHAVHMRQMLPQLADKAREWNEHLSALKALSRFPVPQGEIHAVYPYSQLFGFYELS